MYSALILVIAAVSLGVAAWGLPAARRLGSRLVLFNVAALAAAGLAALLGGLGHWLGAGDQLRDLYALPILISMVALPLTLFTFATICRRLGFAWARPDWSHGAICLYASAMLIYNLRGIFTLKLVYPACWRDVVWYQAAVPAQLSCTGASGGGTGEWPIVLTSVLLAYLGLGAGLWWRDRWPWLLAGMGAGIGLLLAPAAWGPVPYFLGNGLCFSAMMTVAIRHSAPPAG